MYLYSTMLCISIVLVQDVSLFCTKKRVAIVINFIQFEYCVRFLQVSMNVHLRVDDMVY